MLLKKSHPVNEILSELVTHIPKSWTYIFRQILKWNLWIRNNSSVMKNLFKYSHI